LTATWQLFQRSAWKKHLGDHEEPLRNAARGDHLVLTLFAVPKAFEGHAGIIQRNAITSWTLLRPRPEIILFGNEAGVAEICAELDLRHEPRIATTELGAPLLGDLFEQADRIAKFGLLAYVNCDIILMNDFPAALAQVSAAQPRFLMAGRRWDTPIRELWDFSNKEWDVTLRAHVKETGIQPSPPGNSDYFAFPKGLWGDIGPIALGRGGVDPWLVYQARRLGAAVVDTTECVMAVHQNHDQSSSFHRIRQWRKETSVNQALVGGEIGKFCLWDATYLLTPSGLVPARGMRYFIRRVDTLHLFHPRLAAPLKAARSVGNQIRSFRKKRSAARNPLFSLGDLIQSKMPDDGICAILGLGDGPGRGGQPGVCGLELAYALTRVGAPVVVYDPEGAKMVSAKGLLGGPVKFAVSAEECVSDADIVVVVSPSGEFQDLSSTTTREGRRPRVVIDCCGTCRRQPAAAGIEYIMLTGD